jgi:hypothetical protein
MSSSYIGSCPLWRELAALSATLWHSERHGCFLCSYQRGAIYHPQLEYAIGSGNPTMHIGAHLPCVICTTEHGSGALVRILNARLTLKESTVTDVQCLLYSHESSQSYWRRRSWPCLRLFLQHERLPYRLTAIMTSISSSLSASPTAPGPFGPLTTAFAAPDFCTTGVRRCDVNGSCAFREQGRTWGPDGVPSITPACYPSGTQPLARNLIKIANLIRGLAKGTLGMRNTMGHITQPTMRKMEGEEWTESLQKKGKYPAPGWDHDDLTLTGCHEET